MKYLIGFLTIRLLIFEFLNPRKKSRFFNSRFFGSKRGTSQCPGKTILSSDDIKLPDRERGKHLQTREFHAFPFL